MALVGKAVRPRCRRAVTLVEALVVLFVVALIFAILLPQLACPRCSSPQIKCGTQVRNIIQAMTIFAQGNRDSYADILYYDEPDDTTGLNAFLGIWVNGGTLPSQFKGIHD